MIPILGFPGAKVSHGEAGNCKNRDLETPPKVTVRHDNVVLFSRCECKYLLEIDPIK